VTADATDAGSASEVSLVSGESLSARRSRLTADAKLLSAQIARCQLELSETLLEISQLDDFESEWNSIAHWAGWHLGLTHHEARRYDNIATRMGDLPALRKAMDDGALTLSGASATVNVATPATDAAIAELARTATASQLQRICTEHTPPGRRPNPTEFIHLKPHQGGHRLSGWLEADTAETLDTTLAAAFQQLWDATSDSVADSDPTGSAATCLASSEAATTTTPTRDASPTGHRSGCDETKVAPRPTKVDALRHMLHAFLQADGATSGNGGDRWLGLIHLNHDTGGRLSDGTQLDTNALERILCDTSLAAVLTIDGHPAWVTQKQRIAPPWMRRALNSRSNGTCEVEGCTNTGYLEAHHIQHHTRGGATALDNLTNICPHHHRLAHKPGYDLIDTTPANRDGPSQRSGRRTFVIGRADNSTLGRQPPPTHIPPPATPPDRPPTGSEILTRYARDVWAAHLADRIGGGGPGDDKPDLREPDHRQPDDRE